MGSATGTYTGTGTGTGSQYGRGGFCQATAVPAQEYG